MIFDDKHDDLPFLNILIFQLTMWNKSRCFFQKVSGNQTCHFVKLFFFRGMIYIYIYYDMILCIHIYIYLMTLVLMGCFFCAYSWDIIVVFMGFDWEYKWYYDPSDCDICCGYIWNHSDCLGLPSGKLSHNYGKSPFLMGKSTIHGYFQ